ncbi:PREDICTED: uncharacterized protein LOC105953718 [Erythranthe guttata]|uniref:uncharacterized protein LOC105953718 n=1 Tax=Erythranthe guttata TaxID=4155 RepID=UPI00064D81DC|nr:PREDICTED: uncharacterized protein LOC105953718 [Erythranthe guttata]|eukprot:XP_012832859.1 PREDICTED: uncharacterized protein LOC105953718 [Erythranthe guttata]
MRKKQCPWRINARYKEEKQCPWRINASIDKSNNYFYIRKYNNNHMCGIFFDTASKKRDTSDVISPRKIQAQIKENYGLDITYYVSWRSTGGGRDKIFGDHGLSYSYLPAYFREAEHENLGSVFHLEVDKVYSRSHSQLFANRQTTTGIGFLKHFKDAIGKDRTLAFVSDRNHDILQGDKNVFPDCVHGYFYKHLTLNLKDKFRGATKNHCNAVLKQFQYCAYAATKQEFDRNVEKLRAMGGPKVCKFLVNAPKDKWSNAYFVGHRYGQMTSNGCESWNSQIKMRRLLLITNLYDGIRIFVMAQMSLRLGEAYDLKDEVVGR